MTTRGQEAQHLAQRQFAHRFGFERRDRSLHLDPERVMESVQQDAEVVSPRNGRAELLAVLVPLAVLVAAAFGLLAFWYRRDYTHDDFFLAYLSWIRTTPAVAGKDFWVPNFTPLAELASPLFGLFPLSFLPLDILRTMVLIAAITLVALTAAITWELTRSRPWAITSAAVLLLQPDFVARIADVRSDPFSATLVLVVILLILRKTSRSRIFLIGALCGLATTLSTKLVFAAPFLLAAVLLRNGERRPFATLRFAGAFAIAPCLYFAWRIAVDGFPLVSAIFAEVFSSASGGTALADAFGAALRRDPLIAVAVIAGACGFLFVRSGTEDDGRRPFWYAALALGFIALYRRTNPFMYPYAMIMLAPLCAPLVSGVRNFYRTAKARALIDGLVIALVCIVAAGSGVQAYELASSRTNRQQRAFIEWLWSATTPSEQIFDWQGLHFGRRGIPHWWTYGGVLPRYQNGWYTLEQEIRAAHVTLLIPNYRFGWLTENDQQFLTNHYIADSACTLTPGFLLEDPTTPRRIEVLVDGEYDIAADEALLIDGQLRRDFTHLTRGWHLVSAVPESRAERIALVYTTPLRAKRRPPCDQDTVLLYGF